VRQFELVLIIHAHQPIGNFDDVLERNFVCCYHPFIEVLERHPQIRVGLHYTGPLLEWIEAKHPDYFDRLRALVSKRQIEVLGGGFYEPILAVIPPQDRQAQITRLADYVEKHFGARPKGAWLAERVWEPQLPSSLARGGVAYTLVDDNHFLGAGVEADKLYGHYTADDLGHTVALLPSIKTLRYVIPFRDVEETPAFLRRCAEIRPGGFACMGDDLEKFGGWPETYRHCYTDGWLERFFVTLERSSDWLITSTPGDAIASHPSLGQAELPTASYTEMMEWSLPTPARFRYHGLVKEFSTRPDDLPFIRGGTWRGFFSKYSEANLLHKKMLYASRKVLALQENRRREKSFTQARDAAETALLRGQCNDPYWHGVFGGLYAPHLRTAVWKELEKAETIADGLTHRSRHYQDVEKLDFDSNGHEEIYFTSDRYAALVSPAEGGSMAALDFRSANVTLINSLMRRPETYHAKLRNLKAGASGQLQTIDEQTHTKEAGLERWLQYDRWPANAFRLLLFAADKTHENVAPATLEEDATLANGQYVVTDLSPERVALHCNAHPQWPADKTLAFASTPKGFDVSCEANLRYQGEGVAKVNIGIETVINFMAPSAPDRYFEADGRRETLRWSAATQESIVRVVDEWQKVSVALESEGARAFWIAPIETVSESEDGYERVYQGSRIIAVWPAELQNGQEWRGRLRLRASQLD
jgi:4-alpha-glucanotransferase